MSAKAKADSNVEGMNLWRRAVDGHADTPGMPRYPALHLAVHCEVSGMWAGSLFSAVGGSVYALVRRRPFGATVGRAVRWGGPLGFLTGAGMLYGKYLKADELSPARVDDRAFRLRANKGVVREDTAALAGAAVGGVAGFLTAPAGAGRLSRAATAAFGTVALAVAGAKAYTGYEKYTAPKGSVAPGPKAFQALPKKQADKPAAAKADKPAAAPAAPAPAPAAAAKPAAAPAAAEKPKPAPAPAPVPAAAPAAKPAEHAAAPKAAAAPAKAAAADAPAKH